MGTFIENCQCRGVRPPGVIGKRHNSRPDLIARLLRDRHVARFVVAPAGFGKSSTVYEYAHVVFGFEGVAWIKCGSPCFLRDLDSGSLLKLQLKTDAEVRLVVFEDIPVLDESRARAVGELMDSLLERGIEVVATCAPTADSFAYIQRDRVLLGSADLLLSDQELQYEEETGRLGMSANEVKRHSRAACMIWSDDGPEALCAGLKEEALTAEDRLAMLAMLVLREGSLGAVDVLLDAEKAAESIGFIEKSYPFIDIDPASSKFESCEMPMEKVVAAIGGHADELAAASTKPTKERLANTLAGILLERGECERASDIMRLLAPGSACLGWAESNGWEILSRCKPYAIRRVCRSFKSAKSPKQPEISLMQAWALLQMGERSDAYRMAKRISESDGIDGHVRLAAGITAIASSDRDALDDRLKAFNLIMCDVEEAAGRSLGATAELHAFVDWKAAGEVLASASESLVGCFGEMAARVRMFVDAGDSAEGSQAEGGHAEGSRSVAADAPTENALLLAASFLIERVLRDASGESLVLAELAGREGPDALEAFKSDAAAVADFVRRATCRQVAEGKIGWFAFDAAGKLQKLAEGSKAFARYAFPREAAFELSRIHLELASQRDCELRDAAAKAEAKAEFQATHPDPFRKTKAAWPAASRRSSPTLDVRLFGGVDVRIGGQAVDPQLLARRKARTLLALLVVNRGKEVSGDYLATALYGDSDICKARRNLYSIWSILRRALTVEGSCPYLVRSQMGCSIAANLVSSDVYDFEALSRELLFGSSDAAEWERLYRMVRERYCDPLMPGETDNQTIASLRSRYQAQLVDGLISTSARLRKAGEPRGSLWFAREALIRDDRREDVYIALMEAQIAADQRSAAIDTYMQCRSFLAEELGIDPSPKLVELYRSIIETTAEI